jgi:hypothetical protein
MTWWAEKSGVRKRVYVFQRKQKDLTQRGTEFGSTESTERKNGVGRGEPVGAKHIGERSLAEPFILQGELKADQYTEQGRPLHG